MWGKEPLESVEVRSGQTLMLLGLAVSRSLGDHWAKNNGTGLTGEPYVSEAIELQHTDSTVVIASDGVRNRIDIDL